MRVVFDVDRSAQQPEVDLMTRSAFTDYARCVIYLRYSESWPLKGGLLHEMAHLAVGDDEMQCPKELRRLKALGAPIRAWGFRGTSV